MVSKKLTGSMLLGGMLLGIIMVFVEPHSSENSSFAVAVQKFLDNSTQAAIGGIGFTVAILSVTIGTSYLARSMQGEQKLGSDLAGLASVLALLAAATAVVSMGLHMALMETQYANRGGDVATAYAISEGIFSGMFLLIGGTILLLGIAIIRQKNLHQVVGGITVLSGALLVVGMVMPSADPGAASISSTEAIGGTIWFSGFVGWIIMTMAIGILTILSARKNAT